MEAELEGDISFECGMRNVQEAQLRASAYYGIYKKVFAANTAFDQWMAAHGNDPSNDLLFNLAEI